MSGPAAPAARPGRLDAWIALGSPESYGFSWRLRAAAADAGVSVRWLPVLAQGADADALDRAEHDARREGRPFRRPSVFPRDGAPGARAVLACAAEGFDAGALVRAVLDANFVHDHDIADPGRLGEVMTEIDYPAARILERAARPETEAELERLAGEARARGWAGAPVLVAGARVLRGPELHDLLPAVREF